MSVITKNSSDVTDNLLWRHFTEMAKDKLREPCKIVRGEGCYLFDANGNRYLDGISQLICVQLGYSFGKEFAEAAAEQLSQIGYATIFGSFTNEPANRLAQVLADLAPDDLNHVWLTTSGSEGVETCWKMARQYYQMRGEYRWKAISRFNAWHGVTMGALSLTGVPEIKRPFGNLVPGACTIRNTARAGRPDGETEEQLTRFLLEDLEERLLIEDPSTVALVILEPVQCHGGALTAPKGYFEGVRALCDKYDILLASDETITAFGRMGEWFASTRFNFKPDMITTAKGLSSAYGAIGAVIANEKVYAPFAESGQLFTHGTTFGGHPLQAAMALKNIEIMKRLHLVEHVRANEEKLAEVANSLNVFDIVQDVRGAGYMWALEVANSYPNGKPFTAKEMDELYDEPTVAKLFFDRGLLTRFWNDAGLQLFVLAPPLVAADAEFEEMGRVYREVLTILNEKYLKLIDNQ